MEENITEKLLDKILYLQEDLVEERQNNANMRKDLKKYENYIKYLNEENKRQKKKSRNEEIHAFYIGIGITIFFFLLKKFLLWYFF